MSKIKYSLLDLFCGPGGLSLGFTQSGFYQPVVAVEYNQQAADTYEQNFSVKVIRKNVVDVTPAEILEEANVKGANQIDIIVGGPPCQPFSSANTKETQWKKVKAKKEKKGKCVENKEWTNFWRIIEALQPKVFVAENVLGFRKYKDLMLGFIKKSESLGYSTCHYELDAQTFGIPQRRKRIFIIGFMGGLTDEEPLVLEKSPKNQTQAVTVGDALKDLPELTNNSPGCPVSQYKNCEPTTYGTLMKSRSNKLYDHVAHSVNPIMSERFKYIPQGYNLRKTWIEKKIPEKQMRSSYFIGKVEKKFSENTLKNMHSNIYRRLEWNGVSCTIAHVRKTVLIHPIQDRLISVREAARLQSFPDWFRFCGTLNQKYQQIANAVPPLLAKAIAVKIKEKLSTSLN